MTNTSDVQVMVEFPERPGVVEAGIWDWDEEELRQKSEEALNRAMTTIENMAGRVATLKDSISENFKEVQVEFGVKLDVEAGALIAKTGVEASINVTLTWERDKEK